jgi:hypothetical protein
MEGFIVLDYMSRGRGDQRARRMGAGRQIKNKVDVTAWPGERASDAAEAVRGSRQ